METKATFIVRWKPVNGGNDGGCRMAEAYTKRNAEVIKAALEKDKEEQEREEISYYNL